MLKITIHKSRSKNYQRAVDVALSLGAEIVGEDIILCVEEHGIPMAYQTLLPLVEIIGQWKSVETTFRGEPVPLYKFIFFQYNQVKACSDQNESQDDIYCQLKYDVPTWGCRLIDSIQLIAYMEGDYQKSNRYWYNFGSFDTKGRWIIDKDRIYSRIMAEVEKKHLDICPLFDPARIHDLIYNHLPGVIIPDNYNYRLHYEKAFENGREVYRAVNIRHIKDLRTAPGVINKRLLHRIHTAMDHFRTNPAEVPDKIKEKLSRSADELIDSKDAPIFKAFDKDGLGKN